MPRTEAGSYYRVCPLSARRIFNRDEFYEEDEQVKTEVSIECSHCDAKLSDSSDENVEELALASNWAKLSPAQRGWDADWECPVCVKVMAERKAASPIATFAAGLSDAEVQELEVAAK